MQVNPSEDLEILEQVGHCWTYWPEGAELRVLPGVYVGDEAGCRRFVEGSAVDG